MYSTRLKEHIAEKISLIVKEEKCEFHVIQIKFFGDSISPKGVTIDEGKVTAVTSWLT